MASLKDYKLAHKAALEQREVITELGALVKDIERCEKTIVELRTELERVNTQHQDRKTTRDDIAYLEDLLKCANRKLTWEKHIASLKKRTPAILKKMSDLINDPKHPPSDEMRAGMLSALHSVQAAMERLEGIKVE